MLIKIGKLTGFICIGKDKRVIKYIFHCVGPWRMDLTMRKIKIVIILKILPNRVPYSA